MIRTKLNSPVRIIGPSPLHPGAVNAVRTADGRVTPFVRGELIGETETERREIEEAFADAERGVIA